MNSRILIGAAAFALATGAQAAIIGGQVTSGSGSFQELFIPFSESDPDNTIGNNTFQDDNLYAFEEQQNVVLGSDLQYDLTVGGKTGPGAAVLNGGVLAQGTVVASHYIGFDPTSGSVEGWVEFDSDIIAVFYKTNSLLASDAYLNNGVTYLNPGARGLEVGSDHVTEITNRRVYVSFNASTPGDYLRVMTNFSPTAAPEPGVIALLGLGLAGVFDLRRR